MPLSKSEIDYIRYDLRKKGLAGGDLFEELVDHVCCEMEERVGEGSAFKKAYEEVIQNIDPPRTGPICKTRSTYPKIITQP